jgi:hypothetical protein
VNVLAITHRPSVYEHKVVVEKARREMFLEDLRYD